MEEQDGLWEANTPRIEDGVHFALFDGWRHHVTMGIQNFMDYAFVGREAEDRASPIMVGTLFAPFTGTQHRWIVGKLVNDVRWAWPKLALCSDGCSREQTGSSCHEAERLQSPSVPHPTRSGARDRRAIPGPDDGDDKTVTILNRLVTLVCLRNQSETRAIERSCLCR